MVKIITMQFATQLTHIISLSCGTVPVYEKDDSFLFF